MIPTDDPGLLIGVFYQSLQAEAAVEELRQCGFRDDQVSAALCEAHLPTPLEVERAPDVRSRAFAGLIAGSVLAGVLGLVATVWFLVSDSGTGDDLLLTVVGLALIGPALGTFLGGLLGLFWPERAASVPVRERRLSGGVVTVRPEGRDAEASAILLRHATSEPQPARLALLGG